MWTCRKCGEEVEDQFDSCWSCLAAHDPFSSRSLAQYRDVVKNLARPSNEQVESFVQHIAEAHSWYKHLPLLPPGVPFTFFVDPSAGLARILSADGSVQYEERSENDEKYRSLWMTTERYRSQFGYLAGYRGPTAPASAGTQHADAFAKGPLFGLDGNSFRIPVEIAEAGVVELTGIIHPLAARAWIWREMARKQLVRSRSWPPETGGEETLQAALLLGQQDGPDADEKLAALLLPEKRRLERTMSEAIHRMLDLAYGN